MQYLQFTRLLFSSIIYLSNLQVQDRKAMKISKVQSEVRKEGQTMLLELEHVRVTYFVPSHVFLF
jgi:hypothetical protein